MHAFIKNHKLSIWIFLLILIGGFLRFYKLDWGQDLFTHPDEYHIASSVAQLSYPNQMHPHFFSYGTVTIYLIYFTQEIIQIINHSSLIINPFLIGRFYSALFSTLTIIIVYKICRSFMQTRFSYLAALLVALTPGLIQQAHFATPESALIFFLFGSLLFMIKFIKQNKTLYIILASVFLGISLGVKVSSIASILPLIITIIIKSYPNNLHFRKPFLFIKQVSKALLKFTGLIAISIIVAIITFAIVAPYVFLDYSAFRSNLNYEGALAIGQIPVFYTRQFIDTLPVLFQIEKILPYVLGPFLLLFGILGFLNVMLNLFQHLISWAKIPKHPPALAFGNSRWRAGVRNDKRITLIILVLAFLSLFIPNAFLFAKWTRFIAPTFPFFAIFAAIALQTIENKTRRSVYYFLAGVLVFGTVLWTMSFFSIYTNPDIRITASAWLESHVKERSSFLVEGGNMTDIPLAGNFQRTSLDFYSLENDPLTRKKIIDSLQSSDYFLVQSRRVFMNHQRLPNIYPKTAQFYDTLFNGNLGFKQIKEFHSYPKLSLFGVSLEFPDETAEETWSVFDHPVIRIFKKTQQLSKENYAKILE